MVDCVLCTSEITEANNSREHIIPQAIGGRRKVSWFICRNCNSTAGNIWEAEVAKQLNWFSTALNIKRESGKSPPSYPIQTISGVELLMHANGSLAPARACFNKVQTNDGKHEYKLVARTESEARKIIDGLRLKHPNNDFQKILNDVHITSHPLEEPIKLELSVGGPLTERSIVKTTLAMASSMCIPMGHCKRALAFLMDQDAEPVCTAFHLRDLIKNRPHSRLFHAVAVFGNATYGRLLGYVEYYGAFRYIVVLSRSYQGPDVNDCYAIDPITSEEIGLDTNLSLSDAELALVDSNEASPIEARIADLDMALPIVLKIHNHNGRTQRLDAAILEVFRECGVRPGENIPEKVFLEFSARLAEKAAAIFAPMLRRER